MRGWSTKNGICVYRVVFGRCNCYLIALHNTLVLVDTGKTSQYRSLIKAINKVSTPLQTDKYLVITHTHFDHCQNAHRFSAEQGFKIILGMYEESMALAGFSNAPEGTNKFSRAISFLGNSYFRFKLKFTPFTPDLLVPDEMVLNVEASDIKIISTPGHSVGSISVVVDNEIAIVGDALFGIFPKSVFPPFADDVTTMIDSWGKLLNTNCNVFLPGHGQPISRELLQQEYNKWSSF